MSGRWHLRGRRLPDGAPVELWVVDGRLTTEPVADATLLEGFICPGLVDVHAHVSWSEEPLSDAARRALMDERRDVFARQGTLLVRDMGAAADQVLAWKVDGDGLPPVISCGRMVMPYTGYPFPPTLPGGLVASVAERVAHGATWVKVFADWTDDFGGPQDTGFTGHDEVSYPLPELAEATALAHAHGARIAAHAFSAAGAEVAVLAGVDSLEHGWGVEAALLARMAEQGTAWAPLLAIARAMRWSARRAGDASRVAWIEERMAAMRRLLPAAVEAGVVVVAGTDWGPGIPVAHEVQALHRSGLDPEQALVAATTAARALLGHPGLEPGAPADVVVFPQDPREDLERLLKPSAILMGGRSVPPEPPPLPEPPPE